MAPRSEILDVAVIGAGWAGLGISYYLRQASLRHRVCEQGRIGETWRTQRWDSFKLNTPNALSVMPGDHYGGTDPDGFLTCNQFVALLEDYAARNRLPVVTGNRVTELTQEEDGTFRVETREGTLLARNVVIASGSQNHPRRPPIAAALPPRVTQLDACDYRNPAALPLGSVLVVGSAQTGGQIAEDLVRAGRAVFLATGRVGRVPRRYRGRDITYWLRKSGLFDVPRSDLEEPSGQISARPLLGVGHTISLQSLSAQGVVLLGRLTGVDKDGRLTFGADLDENLRFGDESSEAFKRYIDAYIKREELNAPPPEADPGETIAPRLPDPPVRAVDPVQHDLANLIWCTGFEGDFRWVQLPHVLDAQGRPSHQGGVAALRGIYFAGLDFGLKRKSGTLAAVDEESRLTVEHILAHRP